MKKTHRYILLSNDSGQRLELKQAPIGFDGTKFNMLRDLVYIGILKKISVEFDFVGDGFEFMQRHRLKYGVDSDILIRRYRNNPNQFEFEGKVNQINSNEDRKFNKYKVDIIQSSFVQKFQNREDVKYNVLNNISADRLPVVPAALRNATIRGRRIEFYSQFEGSSTGLDANMYHHAIPFLLKVNGNEGVTGPVGIATDNNFPDPSDYPVAPADLAVPDAAFYVNKLPQAQTISVKWRINRTALYLGNLPYPVNTGGDTVFYHQTRIIIRVYDADGNIDSIPYVNLTESAFGNFELSGTHDITVQPGGYATFTNEQCERVNDDGVDEFNNFLQPFSVMDTTLRTEYYYNALEMEITQSSVVDDSIHPALLPHELFANLIAQINGGEFYSEFFGREDLGYDEDGEGAYLGITTGELLRGIPVDEVQIPTSMREAFASYSSVFCLGAIISENRIQVEPLDDLFNANISAQIGEVSELSIVPAKDFLFNSVKCGYPKNEYEEENGRDEFNTTYQYTNSLQAVKKELDLVSKYYGDGYGIEFARRESIITTGTKDTKYDDKIFFIDLIKQEDGTLISRRLEGILHVEGIFSPDTAINLRIAAGQNMLRWNKYLNVPLDKKEKVYYFQSKDKNASLNLVTALGTTIDGQDLDTGSVALFKPEERQFKCPITIDLLFAILANPLGIVHYTYEGEKFFDYLFEVDAETDKGQAVWRMLGTKDSPVQVVEDVDDADILMWGDGLEDALDYGSGELLYQ